ncbi:MAG: 4-methyl-5(B-hydroxyethyl)-thiazole monophosphate biosynthesis protein [Flavobacteriaceae bacterium]|nr:MAG: 4-methyl-5(B-hydroxyethyl)-thiazole monophosphate biosynthesis protein [Flavobacteriaceae bacterium]
MSNENSMKKTKIITSTLFLLLLMIAVACKPKEKTDSLAIGTKDNHAKMMDILFTPPKVPIKKIGVLLYDGYNTLDAVGPYHTLSEIMGAKTYFVAKKRGLVKNMNGMQIKVDSSFADVKSLDILVIPGGAKETILLTQDTETLNWIKEIDKTTQYTASVCTGSWVLGATGLLKGKKVTSNWYRGEEMMKRYGATFQEQRYVKDGKYWTSAGVSAGIDMSLAMIDDLLGRKYTEAVMLDLEYDPKPPYNAGTPKKSDPMVAEMMKQMYDMLMLPLIEKTKPKN